MPIDDAGKRAAHAFRWLTREPLLAGLILLGGVLALFDPQPWRAYMIWLDLPAVTALLGLLAVAQAIRASGLIQRHARTLLRHVPTLRGLALLLIALSALLSMFLTNDVSLFLIVPLTLALAQRADLPVMRLVIFEALAVNAGSSLSPLGNPQNLVLWHYSGVSMAAFVQGMAPAVLIMLLVLGASAWWAFPARALRLQEAHREADRFDATLAWLAPLMLLVFIVLLEMQHVVAATGLALLVLGALRPGVLRELDWMLVATIVAMLVTMGHLAALPMLDNVFATVDWHNPDRVYLAGVLLSQLISNVPATIALLHRAPDPLLLAMAVNVGASGLVIGSLANLIALRLEGSRRIWLIFHLYSIPYLLVVGVLVAWLLI